RPPSALSRFAVLGERGNRDLLRIARPEEREGLEGDWSGERSQPAELLQARVNQTPGTDDTPDTRHARVSDFRKPATTKPPELTTLLTDDERFRDSATSAEAYAQAWALTYFLIRT